MLLKQLHLYSFSKVYSLYNTSPNRRVNTILAIGSKRIFVYFCKIVLLYNARIVLFGHQCMFSSVSERFWRQNK